jgi:hypothetical protein
MGDMTDKVSVRLGDLLAAVDAEARKERRGRSEMIRFLIEEALGVRQDDALEAEQNAARKVRERPQIQRAAWQSACRRFGPAWEVTARTEFAGGHASTGAIEQFGDWPLRNN